MDDIVVISDRDEIVEAVNSICKVGKKIINSSEEAVSYLGNNKPLLVIVDLETKDLNIFVAHELLKVCKSTNESRVIIVFSENTKSEIESYNRLLHPPDEFIKDSEIIIKLEALFEKYVKNVKSENSLQEDNLIENNPVEDESNEESGEAFAELDIFDNSSMENEELNQGIFTVEDGGENSGEFDISISPDIETKTNEIQIKKAVKKTSAEELITDIEKEIKKQDVKFESNRADRGLSSKDKKKLAELNAEVISLQKQNEFMKNENKELIQDVEEFKGKFLSAEEELNGLNNELEVTKNATKDLIESKEKEIEELKNILETHKNQLSSEIETMKNTFEAQKSELSVEIEQIKSDKKTLESSLMDEINLLKSDKSQLEKETGVLKSGVARLNEESEEFKNQLNIEKNNSDELKKEIVAIEKAKDEKEKILITSIEHLKKNITSEEEKAKKYKEKLDGIVEISKDLSKIVKDIK